VDLIKETAGQDPACLVADAGFDSSQNAALLEERGIVSYLNPKGQEAEFWDVLEDGRIACPKGHGPVARDLFVRKGVLTVRLYVKECPACPERKSCHVGRYKYLSAPHGVDPRARIRNAHRCRSPEGRLILGIRGPGIETVFGQLKWNKRFRRFRLRGLDAVRSEFQLECLAHNLQKVLKDLLLLLSHRLLGRKGALATFPGAC